MKPTAKPLNSHQIADLIVLCTLATVTTAYFFDAYHASTKILNLILILPVTSIVLVLCLLEFIQQIRGKAQPNEKAEPIAKTLPVMALFVGYVLTLPWLGFDVGTCLFICAYLWVYGERRWRWIAGYGLSFTLLMTSFFSMMLPYPMPMLLFSTAY